MRNRTIFGFIIFLTLFLSVSAISASENVTCDNLTSSYDSNDLLTSDDTYGTGDINKSATKISANDKVSYVDYKDSFTVKLSSNGADLVNKSVIISLNHVNYNKITDSKGQATIDFKLKTGTYTVGYYFAGDENYTSSWGNSIFTVKSDLKTSLKLIDKTQNHCEGVKSVFHLNLVDVYGNGISGKTVKINVGGKTYSAKTNSKGNAVFYISLKKGTNDMSYYFSETGKYVDSSGISRVVVKSKLSKGNGYWVNQWDMKKVNLKKLSKLGTKHIFLLHTAFQMYGKSSVLKWIKKAHSYGMQVHLWVSVFFNNGKFITPCSKKGVYNYKQMNKVIKKVKYYAGLKEVDGIHFDYIRFPGNAYKYKNAVKAVNYFTEKASKAVRDVRPGIIVSAAVMPEPSSMKHYYAQDIKTMSKHLDVIAPMIYKGNYHATSKWIKKTTRTFIKMSNGAQIWSGLQTYKSDSNIKKLSYKTLFKDAKAAKSGGAAGVVLFRWGLSALLNFNKLYH